jgi:hypothetical protein
MADDNSTLIVVICVMCICFMITQFLLIYDIYLSYKLTQYNNSTSPSTITVTNT